MDRPFPPSKEKVRQWLGRRIAARTPPDARQIRRELGWDLAAAEREALAGQQHAHIAARPA